MYRATAKSRRFLVALLILSSCIGCDQATKRIATQTLPDVPRSYLGNVVRLEYALNPGGFLSVGSHLPDGWRFALFIVLNTMFLVVLASILLTRWNMRLGAFVATVYVLAGGAGNLIDRATQDGYVTDFINLGVGPLRTGIFNVADVAVTFGGLALICLWPRHRAQDDTEREPISTA